MEIQEDEKQIEPVINSINENNINNSENNNNISKNNISIYLDTEIIPIIDQLIEIGYNKIYSKRLVAFYHPRNIEEALNYFLKEGGIIQHFYIEDKESLEGKICFLCGEKKEIHLGNIPENYNNNLIMDNDNDIKSNSLIINDLNNNYNKDDNNLNKELISNKNNSINNFTFKKEECPICSNLFIPCSENKLEKCGHSFCHDCWYNFLSIKIKENKLTFIKCLNYECQEKLSDEFIINLLNSNQTLIEKYKKYKLELEIINDPNKKFCPYPNCNSYAVLQNIKNKYVKCLNNHKFCFLCLEKPHGKVSCNEKLDKSIINYSKNNFIKKCPHCGIITEKSEGCNHITCSKCSYQWCWLCNEKYNTEHFRQGKCKGYQFFRPKNEKDIELAFQGKIVLNESQRQHDLENENERPINRFRPRNIRYYREDFDDFEPRFRRHNDFPQIHRRYRCFCIRKILKLFLSFFIYLTLGHVILPFKGFLNKLFENINHQHGVCGFIYKLEIITIYFLITLINIFPQIIINFCMFIFYCRDGFCSFMEKFNSIMCGDIYNYSDDFILFFYIFIYFFEAEIFLKLYYFFAHKKSHLKRRIFLISYFFIGFFHIITYFPYYILFGIINIILKLLSKGNIQDDLEDLIKANLIEFNDN